MTAVKDVITSVVSDWETRMRRDIKSDIMVTLRFYAHHVRHAKTADDAIGLAGEIADELYRIWRHYSCVRSIQAEVDRLRREHEEKTAKLVNDDRYVTAVLERDARRAKPLQDRLRASLEWEDE